MQPLPRLLPAFLTLSFTLALSPPAFSQEPPAPAPAAAGCVVETLVSILKGLDKEAQLRIAGTIAKDPELKAQVLKLLKEANSGKLNLKGKETKALAIKVSATLQDSGELPVLLRAIAAEAGKMGKLPKGLSPEKQEGLIQQLAGVIDAELSARGLTQASKGAQYEDWLRVSSRVLTELDRELEPLRAAGKIGFEHPEYLKLMEKQTGSTFTEGNLIKPLINGPDSFAESTRLIENAKKRIRVLSWAFYDDTTGMHYAQKLIEAKKRGVDVKILVDGQVAAQPTHGQALKLMEDSGIEIVRWKSSNPLRKYDGQHRKIMIVDDIEAKGGGMNFGDVYSHMGPAETAKWRDTDIYVKGPAAVEADRLFVKLWNGQIEGNGLKVTRLEEPLAYSGEAAGTAKVSLVNHVPGTGENILRDTLLAIEGAKKTVDIENAYLILNPAVYKKILEAKKRGVRVRVLTNSSTSIDEPVITRPIMRTVNHLHKNGVEVYLKKGTDTLHSKFIAIDGQYSWLGSENLHPRSYRYEGEMILSVPDAEFTARLAQTFQNDIAVADKLNAPVPLQPNMTDEISELFYDQF